MQLVTRSILQVGGTHNALGLPHPGWKADTLSLCFLGAQASPPTSSDSRYRSPCCPLCLTSRGIFPYPGLGMLVVAFVSGNLSTCPLPRKDLAPPRPPLGGSSHWNMRCSVFKAHKGKMTACAVMGSSIATGSAAGGVKIVDATDLHTQVRAARHGRE